MTMTAPRLTDILSDAQNLLFDAIELLDTYVRETNDIEADNYLVAQLKILASRQHGYLTSDLNLDDLLERVDETDDDEEDDDDDASTRAPQWVNSATGYFLVRED